MTRSGTQFHGYTVHQRSAEKSFVCNLPDSGRLVTRPNQGLSTGGRENLEMRLH